MTSRSATEASAEDLVQQNRNDSDFLDLTNKTANEPSPTYNGMTGDIFEFTTDGYEQRIRMKDADSEFGTRTDPNDRTAVANRLRRALNERDVAVWCSDPSFKYWGWMYRANTNNYLLGDHSGDNEFPDEQNPGLQRATCKHLHKVLTKLNDYEEQMIEDVQSTLESGGFSG